MQTTWKIVINGFGDSWTIVQHVNNEEELATYFMGLLKDVTEIDRVLA